MPTIIMPVLTKLRQDLARSLSAESIHSACRRAKYSWRNRKLNPAATISYLVAELYCTIPILSFITRK